ncbi:Rho guanine nucleotide exchange factor [Salix suchowensis]|nr:Rho guanine nucleotide exchange factor [Salix suchowensis]
MGSSSSYVLNPMVSPEEFKIFHTIDRTLYTRLVVNLDRDPAESMQVVALWIWLEREARDNLVKRMLALPDTLINSLADEAVLCLNCIETDRFHFSTKTVNDEIPLTQQLTKTGFSLRFFHDNRLGILRAITKIINEVCARAFEDILDKSWRERQLQHPGILPGNDPYDLAVQRQIMNTENIAAALNRVKISAGDQKEDLKEMQADSRTIFLTFSKGYPISEDEVRDYFTKKHGVCIEAIYMQEVSAEEQPLYARLVVPSAAILHDVLLGQSKAKFTINGKHVWARKYVRKNPKSPSPSKSPTSPQPTSPDTEPSSLNWV